MEELGAQQPAPQNRDSPVVPVRTNWYRRGGPQRVRRFRREPLTLSAVGVAVLIGATCGAASGVLTSFAMSNSKQAKKMTKLLNLGR